MLPTKPSGSKTAGLCDILFLCSSMTLLLLIFFVPAATPVTSELISSDNVNLRIEPGSSIQREVTPGAKEVFEVFVDQDKILHFSLDKGDLVLATALYDPSGNKLLEHKSEDFEVIELSVPTHVSGTYRIELQSHEKTGASRPYQLTVQPLTPVTELNRNDSEARQALALGDLLQSRWTRDSFLQAVEQYDKAARIWRSIPDPSSAAKANLKAGDVYFILSDYAEASERYQNAQALAAKTTDWLVKARALSHRGRLQSYLGENDVAQAQLDEALHILDQHDAKANVIANNAYGVALSNLAEVSYSKGNFVKSFEQSESALKVFQNDRKGAARAHLFLGYLNGSIGERERAVAEISEAQELYKAINDKNGAGLTQNALGLAYSYIREDTRAIEMHLRAQEIFRKTGDRHSEGLTLNALGQAYQSLNEYSIALDRYDNALRIFQSIGAVDSAAVSLYQMATIHSLTEHPDLALKYYQRCLSLSRAARNVRTEANALKEIARVYLGQGRQKEAFQQYERVRRFYETIGDLRGQAQTLNAHGELLFKVGKKEEARDLFEQSLQLSEKVGEPGILISTLYDLALANRDLGLPQVALSFIQRSLQTIEDLRANVESPEFRVSYLSGLQKHYQLCINILMQLEQQRPGENFAAQAFLVNEKSHARGLLDLVNESRAEIQDGAAKELLERERMLRGLFRRQGQYRLDLSLSGKNSAELAEVESQMTQLRADYQEVMAQLRQHNHGLLSPERSDSLQLDQIQQELRGSDTILLQYALGDERSFLWAVTANSLQSYELPARKVLEDAARESYTLITTRQNINPQVDTNYQSRIDSADRLLKQKMANLSQMLLAPVARQLGNKRLLFVAEGALQYVPFAALPFPGQAFGDGEATKLLLETNEVVVEPSISTLIAIRKAPNRKILPGKLVAVIADPVFNGSDARVRHDAGASPIAVAPSEDSLKTLSSITPVSSIRDGLGRLTHSAEEADAISATAPWGTSMVARGFDASRQTAMSPEVSQYQIIHFATHGFIDSEHPELSGIVLTMVDRNGASMDGLMPLHDIHSLNLSAELTVLSACQTALGKDIKGEGLVGLTHSFMSAGSKSVIASLWKVDDRATAMLMADLYESMLQKGMTPAEALRTAKLKMMQDKRWSAPYYWAGFVLQGEYANHIAVSHYSWFRPRLVLVVLILTAIGAFGFFKRKRRFSS
ncbi:MAG TPA: CHAT domain-containing protein [Pyrinomonadaceae bacterium]|nr:CHAT domain-containing protein [Pyrinomonadaceae bacterium]